MNWEDTSRTAAGISRGKANGALAATPALTSADAVHRRCPQERIRKRPESTPRPVRYPGVTYGCLVEGQSYTGTGRAASAPVVRSPGASGFSAVPSPMAAGLAEREAQRSVHARVSRQYQRRSWQALPPSGTIWSARSLMPHIQQDLALACCAQYRTERSWSGMACSSGRSAARAVLVARGAGTFNGAAGASSGGCSRPAAWSASGSSCRSVISDAPASYGQPVFMCKPFPPVSGHLVCTGACARRRVCPPPTGRAHRFVSFHVQRS